MRQEILKRIDIVIPVYNAYESLVACVDSIKRHTDLNLHRVIIINDCSPDARIQPYVDSLAGDSFVIIHNEKNKGFSANVNIGMTYSGNRDVILLNSDTIVTKGWVEKLVACAYSSDTIGTVTPLSNSATIASVPVAFVDNPLPEGKTVDEFAELVEHCSFCEYPRITVAVGFCMYIKREVIEKVGLFDAETFQRGYGEENDFCSRAEIYGYEHVLCDNTLIYHEGTQSFLTEEKEQLQREHRAYLDEHYPKQMRENDLFCQANPQQYLRDNIKLHLALENGKKNVLYLSHYDFKEGAQNNCGGTQFHVKDLKENLVKEYNIFVAARDGNELLLTAYVQDESYTFRFAIDAPASFYTFSNRKLKKIFSMVLDACRIDLVHIQNVMGLSLDLFYEAKKRNIPLLLTLHDYFWVCPNYTLLNQEKKLCYGSCTSCEGRNACLGDSIQLSNAPDYLEQWRKNCSDVMELCQHIFAPSCSVKKICEQIYPHLKEKITVIEHGFDIQPDTREKIYVEPEKTGAIRWGLDSFFDKDGYSDLISGWALLLGEDNSETKIYVDIEQPDGSKKRYEATKTERPDVDSTFVGNGKYRNTGFFLGIHFGDCKFEVLKADLVIEHAGKFYSGENTLSASSPRPLPARKMNIAFVGGINFEKGSAKAYELIMSDVAEEFNWYIMGGISPTEALYQLSKNNVKKIGFYSRGEIYQLLKEYQIDLVCIFSIVSETFCYTLSEAYMNQIPVLALNVGAVGERVQKLQCGWLMDTETSADEMLKKIWYVLEHPEERERIKNHITKKMHKSTEFMAREYSECYSRVFHENIHYQKYDAKFFYEAYEVVTETESVAGRYRKEAEELQKKLDSIERSFWYKATKNLYHIEFPGKQKLRKLIYHLLKKQE